MSMLSQVDSTIRQVLMLSIVGSKICKISMPSRSPGHSTVCQVSIMYLVNSTIFKLSMLSLVDVKL